MGVNTKQVSVGTTAARIDPTKPGQMIPRGALVIRNRGTAPIYLGDSTVSVSTGYQLDAGEAFTADLGSGDALYGITATDPQPCHILQVGGAA